MSMPELEGKAQTVLGVIDSESLGVTLPHEHFIIDMSVWFREPEATSEKQIAYQPVGLENLGWINYHPFSNVDNVRLMNEELAVKEVLRYQRRGGNSVVDLTTVGLGRDPLALARISRATGLNIIMGSGYYAEEAKPQGVRLTEEMITEEIVRDITVGAGNTGIQAGIIGEIGIGLWPLTEGEKRTLRAVARAQQQTGAAVNIHPGNSPNSPFEIIDVLDRAGADVTRVVISHIERTVVEHNIRVKLAKTGCYLEYDLFGFEGWYPSHRRMVVSEDNPKKADLPNDAERINQIMALINEGFLRQILISTDNCMKNRLYQYGGPGYAHILDNVVPLMREKDVPEEHIRMLVVENPKRLLTLA